ncbi:photosystem II 5 kDa protein, chloroplastic [Typha angustifolia]|uniref:photosystem II 5 kDa protein, chloroplastic n=1 Tax=Typha angustifolia TaxID=59011 RepID=UPI003C2C88DD
MASLTTMMASFTAGAAVADRPSVNRRRSLVIAKAASKVQCDDVDNREHGGSGGRRAAMLAVAAAAVSTIGSLHGVAIAGEVPKAGTPEAKKFYAPVCVTMPTAKACHK